MHLCWVRMHLCQGPTSAAVLCFARPRVPDPRGACPRHAGRRDRKRLYDQTERLTAISRCHGRFSGHGRPRSWVAADIVRFEDGKLAEHWDVLQDEATQAESLSGRPMFGDRFPA